MRAYKTVNDAYIEPISFTVPRRAETFQADIFPPATGTKPAATAQEWFDGKTAIPNKIDLESVYDGTAPKEITSEFKAPAAPSAVTEKPATKMEEPKKEEAKPAPALRSPPSMSEQKGSISAMASRYQDKQEEEEDDDDASSFEEVSRPAQRQAVPTKFTPPAQPQTAPAPSPAIVAKPSSPVKTPAAAASAAPPLTSPAPRAVSPAPSGSDSSLAEIKQLIEGQTKLITLLTAEVEALKRKVSSGSQDQSERIRQLELELEEARS
jgi:coronin-1B/1C/6